MTKRQLILSSTSPARRELLSRLLIPFTVCSPDVDETALAGEPAEKMVSRLAKMKATTPAHDFPDALIIGADLVGTLDNHVLNKPLTPDAAFKQLSLVSGKTVRFYTGLCLYDAFTQQLEQAIDIYDVSFRELSDDAIKRYLHLENVLNCAGSFHIEGLGITLVEKLAGYDYTSLIGLPLIRLTGMLKKMDVDVLGA